MLKLFLAEPRGFCAGVERAIDIVDIALEVYGKPVYVNHEIVHNKWVVADFIKRGVIFIGDLKEVPDGANLVFSAHGVPPSLRELAKKKELNVVDATCPLVTKVHLEVHFFLKKGYHIFYIGHKGHQEVVGVLGEAPHELQLVTKVEDVANLPDPKKDKLIYLSQTTLSVTEVQEIIDALRKRFPTLEDPPASDICYATENRQQVVKKMAPDVDLFLVVGSQNSSNSNRMVDVAKEYGVEAYLIDTPDEIDEAWLKGKNKIGISSGASVPDHLVEDVINFLKEKGVESLDTYKDQEEDVLFVMPPEVRKFKGKSEKVDKLINKHLPERFKHDA